jgi:hypothetical protein
VYVLGELSVLVVFIRGAELLDDARNAVRVSVPASGEPYATTLVDAFHLAVGADS